MMIFNIRTNQKNGIKWFVNKVPRFDPVKKTYLLNFSGRVTKASVKNFQIIENASCLIK